MGYTHGRRWTDETTAEAIMEIANTFDPVRMPSSSEVKAFCGDTSLSDRISKTGGFYEWANRLGLEVKYSETKLGIKAEHDISKRLCDLGFTAEMTSSRYPYDLLVNGCVKVDVKAANKSDIRGCDVYAYRIAKRQQTCDFYIFCEMSDEEIIKTYVVPASAVSGQVQVEMGTGSTIYDVYAERYDLIGMAVDFYKSIEQF